MSTQLATIAQYFDYRGERMPEDLDELEALELDALLKRASNRIRAILRTARLTWGNDGLPKNGTVAQTIAEATAAQASFMRSTGDVDGSAAVTGWDDVSMDGVSYGRRGATAAVNDAKSKSRVAPEVGEILGALPIWTTKSNRR